MMGTAYHNSATGWRGEPLKNANLFGMEMVNP